MRRRHYCCYSQYTFVVCNQRLQTGANLVHMQAAALKTLLHPTARSHGWTEQANLIQFELRRHWRPQGAQIMTTERRRKFS